MCNSKVIGGAIAARKKSAGPIGPTPAIQPYASELAIKPRVARKVRR